MQILVANTKGGCGKSTISACLAEVLESDLVDHDPQGTLKLNSDLIGRLNPVSFSEISKKFIVHDTPPYNTTLLTSLIKEVDLILIPCKVSYPDVLALSTIVDKLHEQNSKKKGVIILNEVRSLNRKLNLEVKNILKTEYPEIKIAKTEIPNWIGFSKILAHPLGKREKKRIQELVEELNIHKNHT